MYRSFLTLVPLLGLLPLPGAAQSATFNGPIAGFIYHRDSRTIRPLVGIPGATYIASSVLSDIDSASISPDSQWAFVRKSSQGVFVKDLSAGSPLEMPVEGLIPNVDRVIWNRSGSFALLYSHTSGQMQRVRLSGQGPAADSPVDLSPWGAPSALAIDPTGQQIAFGITGAGLFLWQTGQSAALLSSMAKPAALAFDHSHLYAVDLDQQQILQFDPGSGPLSFASLAPPEGSPALNPVGIAASDDGSYLMLADASTRSVLVYETATRNLVNTIPLDFAPTRLEPLSSGSGYVLNGDISKEWLLVLDARRIPAVYFVPVTQEQL